MSICGLVIRILLVLAMVGYFWHSEGWRAALALTVGLLFGAPLVLGIFVAVNYLLTWCGCVA